MDKFFEMGTMLGDDLTQYALGKIPVAAAAMIESVTDTEKPPVTQPLVDDHHQQEPVPMTLEQAHQAILEAATTAAKRDQLDGVADAVFSWADSDDTGFDALDGFVQALAGLDDDDPDADPTDEEIDNYNTMWDAVANFLIAAGEDPDTVSSMADDEDDDAANAIASDLAAIDQDTRDELSVAYQASADDSMMESVKKVIRNGEITLIRRKPRKRRMTAAQKMALKKARMKAHSSSAKLSRAKSMKLRMKTFGKRK
jgi:hypothetical protein